MAAKGEESEFESVLRELRVYLELECGSTKGRHFLAKKKNLTFKLSKWDQVRGVYALIFIYEHELYND